MYGVSVLLLWTLYRLIKRVDVLGRVSDISDGKIRSGRPRLNPVGTNLGTVILEGLCTNYDRSKPERVALVPTQADANRNGAKDRHRSRVGGQVRIR